MAKAKQISLLPTDAPTAKFQRIKTADFKRHALVGPEPTRAMISSVEHLGVFSPIIVFRESDRWHIGDGVRRIKAALAAEVEDIPAMVYPDKETMRHGMTLIANTQRSANPLAEVKAILALQKKNFSAEQIGEATGMPIRRVQERLRITALVKPLHNAIFKGDISISVGQACAKLPQVYQRKLAAILEKEERLTLKDVAEVKSIRRKEALAAMPAEIFGTVNGGVAQTVIIGKTAEERLTEIARDVLAWAVANGQKFPLDLGLRLSNESRERTFSRVNK